MTSRMIPAPMSAACISPICFSPRSTNAHIRQLPPAPARSAPAKSNRPTICPTLSRIPAITRNPATMAIGTLIRKAQRHEKWVTISVPRSGPATLAIAHALLAAPSARPRLPGGDRATSEQNKRKSGNSSCSDALDGASADELHHRARDGAESAPGRERNNADEIRASASPSIGPWSPDRHRYRRGEHVSRKCPRVEVGTAKLGQRHRHHRADDSPLRKLSAAEMFP